MNACSRTSSLSATVAHPSSRDIILLWPVSGEAGLLAALAVLVVLMIVVALVSFSLRTTAKRNSYCQFESEMSVFENLDDNFTDDFPILRDSAKIIK